MSQLGKSMSYNMLGQLVARILSFGINMYLLRVVDGTLLGLVNVSLTLLYSTILFLTREPFRKGDILNLPWQQFINTIWISPLLGFALSFLGICFWTLFASADVPFLMAGGFALAAFIETLAEPFAIISLRFSLSGYFAVSQALLVLLPKLIIFIFTLTNIWTFGPYSAATAQILASSVYVVFNFITFYQMSKRKITELPQVNGYQSFFPVISAGLDKPALKSIFTLIGHSFLKQLLTDGSGYIMSFTNIIGLKNQAIYDSIEKLGSLVARIVLAPLEESCYADFSRRISQLSAVFEKNNTTFDSLVQTFTTVLHGVSVICLTVCFFGIPYSKLALTIYSGGLLATKEGEILLVLYMFYLYVMAINGITECFAVASMKNVDLGYHGGFLSFMAVLHGIMNISLPPYIGSAGFIIANIINMILRISYSWRQISGFLKHKTPSIFEIFPNGNSFILQLFFLMATSLSYLFFANTPGWVYPAAHIAVGAVLFFLYALQMYSSDYELQLFCSWFYKKHQE